MEAQKWEDLVPAGSPYLPWLAQFDEDPKGAIGAALRGQFYFGSLNLTDPGQLIWGLYQQLGAENQFNVRFADALDNLLVELWERRQSGVDEGLWVDLFHLIRLLPNDDQKFRLLKKMRSFESDLIKFFFEYGDPYRALRAYILATH